MLDTRYVVVRQREASPDFAERASSEREMDAPPLQTRELGRDPDAVAPDGSEVRLLAALAGGSFAHFTLAPNAVSAAVAHRTVEEIWYFVAGGGRSVAQAPRRRECRRGKARRRLDDSAWRRVPVPRRGRRSAIVRGGHHAALAGSGRGFCGRGALASDGGRGLAAPAPRVSQKYTLLRPPP
jgi:mannose-6-phosphate isomerase-like protein (cupin superfamily)